MSLIRSGLVRLRHSLLPLSSPGMSLSGPEWKSSSSSSNLCIIVPVAPSRMRILPSASSSEIFFRILSCVSSFHRTVPESSPFRAEIAVISCLKCAVAAHADVHRPQPNLQKYEILASESKKCCNRHRHKNRMRVFTCPYLFVSSASSDRN